MSDEFASDDVGLVQEKVSRRGLFKFIAKVGVGLVSFIPAAGALLQNVPAAHAAGPDYPPCTRGYLCQLSSGCGCSCKNSGLRYACFDAQNPQHLCCCSNTNPPPPSCGV